MSWRYGVVCRTRALYDVLEDGSIVTAAAHVIRVQKTAVEIILFAAPQEQRKEGR